jgi:uncharacterized membrane protein YtjA (UPF0391 family)
MAGNLRSLVGYVVKIMLSWAPIFLLLALYSGFLGFSGSLGATDVIAQIMCIVFVVLFVVSWIGENLRKNPR